MSAIINNTQRQRRQFGSRTMRGSAQMGTILPSALGKNQVTISLNSHIEDCGSQKYVEKPTLSMVYNVIKGLKKKSPK